MAASVAALALAACGAQVGGNPTGGDGGGSGSGTGGSAAGGSGAGGSAVDAGRGGAGGSGGGGVDAGRGGAGGAGGGAVDAGRGGAGGTAVDAGRGGAGGGSTGGSGGSGAGGAAGATAFVEPACVWPTASGANVPVSATMRISGSFDGGMKRYVGSGSLGGTGQNEGQDPLFQLANGATLQNVIIGSPAADGIHCSGTCTLKNVWWEDVGEDAATSEGTAATTMMTIDGGGAKAAADKVFQHNGGGTMVIRNFCLSDFGKVYRSCGNCGEQFPRHAIIENVSVTPSASSQSVAGINSNYGDTADLHGIFMHSRRITVCERYMGNDTGAEPPRIGTGPDPMFCRYNATTDVIFK